MGRKSRLVVIDGHSQIYRAVYVRGAPLSSPTGEPTRGTFYFLKMLETLVRRLDPDFLVVALDGDRRRLVRRQIFPQYKQNRGDEIPDEIMLQVKRIKQMISLLGVPTVTAPGWEADDVIATLVKGAKECVRITIVSRDKDLHQLLESGVAMYDPIGGEFTKEADVIERWGVPPDKVAEVQALCGDPTDCVPGVKGIGPGRATKLIKEYGSIEGLVEGLEDLPDKMQENFAAADLDLCLKLVRLVDDLYLEFDPEDANLTFQGLDYERARPLFRKLGFKRVGSVTES